MKITRDQLTQNYVATYQNNVAIAPTIKGAIYALFELIR